MLPISLWKSRQGRQQLTDLVLFLNISSVKLQASGPMPNVMAALPNTGGIFCSTPQSLADAHYWSAVQ